MRQVIVFSVISFVMIVWGINSALGAPTLTWVPSAGATDTRIYCGVSPTPATPTQTIVAVPTAMLDLAGQVVPGTRYECWATAGFPDPDNPGQTLESADSNHIRFTPPTAVQIIELPDAPPNGISITW